MKRTLLISLLIIVSLVTFANGDSESQNNSDNTRPIHDSILQDEAIITLTGSVAFENRIHPELTVGGQKYLLMVGPAMRDYPDTLKEGQQVTVEGYVLTEELIKKLEDARADYQSNRGKGNMMGPLYNSTGDEKTVIVEAVTIDGKRYEIDYDNSRRGNMRGKFNRGKGMGRMM
ncbi:MAG: hypothetical protein JXR70_02450 [Spirochaetales bacterium]|nr:hypothetical protein [Spirochaetales bacterium]